MTTTQIRLKVEDFRAVKRADIILNGITIAAGENGSGKSTISKLLYYLYKTVSNYDSLVSDRLRKNLRDIIRFLDIVIHDLHPITKDRNTRDEIRRELSDLARVTGVEPPDEEQLSRWLSLIKKAETTYSIQLESNVSAKTNFRTSRWKYILKDVLSKSQIEENDDDSLPFEKIGKVVESKFKEAFGKIQSRPISLFFEELENVFADGVLPKRFEVLEFEDSIISNEKNNLSIPYSIQNVVYIDTPMMIGIENSENQHWEDLNELLVKKGQSSSVLLTQTISKDVIGGEVSIDENAFSSNDYSYKRDDGSVYNLLDCATGIKSFAIIQLLLKNGSLNDKTLVILDEPESHLHPQWIIEYARLIVLLNKQIGVKFFIASHNPDMVSAIKYISEREKSNANLNFYLAQKTNTKYSYDYKWLDQEIDPIFESFNIAIARINQYGI